MAGLGARLFPSFTKLTSAQVNGYLMDQTVMRFASTAARDVAFGGANQPTLAEGMICYLDDTNSLMTYSGSGWVNAVNTASVQTGAITTGLIATNGVEASNIATDAVTTVKIADLNVTTGKLAANAVTTAKITDLNVTTGKINDLAITTGKINANAVTGAKVSTGFLTTYADLNITGMNTDYTFYLVTLPASITYDMIVSVVPLSGVNDTVTLFAVRLGNWSGVQTTTQISIAAALGNAVASTTGSFRIYYRV